MVPGTRTGTILGTHGHSEVEPSRYQVSRCTTSSNGPPGRAFDGRQGTIGGVPQRDQLDALTIRREPEHVSRHRPVGDRRMAAADTQIRGRQHEAHRRLAHVELERLALVRIGESGVINVTVAADLATWSAYRLGLGHLGCGGADMSERSPEAQLQLANERTYLAWLRTALALVAAGVAAARLLAGSRSIGRG